MDSELVLELEPAPGWALVSELAMESDSVQALAEPRDSASPPDLKLRFPLLPVFVAVNGDRAQRCVQARTNTASLHPAPTLMLDDRLTCARALKRSLAPSKLPRAS